MPERKLTRELIRWLILEGSAIVVSILLAFWIDAWCKIGGKFFSGRNWLPH